MSSAEPAGISITPLTPIQPARLHAMPIPAPEREPREPRQPEVRDAGVLVAVRCRRVGEGGVVVQKDLEGHRAGVRGWFEFSGAVVAAAIAVQGGGRLPCSSGA